MGRDAVRQYDKYVQSNKLMFIIWFNFFGITEC